MANPINSMKNLTPKNTLEYLRALRLYKSFTRAELHSINSSIEFILSVYKGLYSRNAIALGFTAFLFASIYYTFVFHSEIFEPKYLAMFATILSGIYLVAMASLLYNVVVYFMIKSEYQSFLESVNARATTIND